VGEPGGGLSHPQNNFDFLRLFLATLVIFSHSYQLTGHSEGEPVGMFTNGLYSLGHLAVDGFFAISGYLITQSWLTKPEFWLYLRKRVLRICPGYWVAFFVCIFVIAPLGADSLGDYFGAVQVKRMLLRAVFLQGPPTPPIFLHVPHPDHLNGSLWSIPYEFLCYLMVPALAGLGLLGRRRWMLALFVACYIPALYTYTYQTKATFETMSPVIAVQQAAFFLSGMLMYLWRDKIVIKNYVGAALVAVLVLSIRLGNPEIVTPWVVAPIMVWLAFAPWLNLRRAAKHGDFSYGIYLYAYPIQQLIVSTGVRNVYGLFLLAVPVTVGAAFLSWRLIESPALRLKKPRGAA